MATGDPPIGGCIVEFPARYGCTAPCPSGPWNVIDYGQYQAQPGILEMLRVLQPQPAPLADSDIERIARRVAELLRDSAKEGG